MAPPTFQSPTAAPSGDCCNSESSFAVGDFNQDGKLDVLVGGGPCACNGQLLLGNGDGTFQPAITWASAVQNISTADLNGDGILDAVSNDGGNTSVFLGKGDGSFFPSEVIWGNGQVRNLGTIADVKGDGKEDVLLLGNGLLSVVLGNGDGTFQVSTQISAVPESVECCQVIARAADLNADGKPDLIFFLSQHIQNGITGAVGVDLGNGDGTFQSGLVSLSGSHTQTSSTVADFNGDGKLDLAVQGSILLGNGDGTFQPPTEYSFGGEAEVAADFNNDGKLDLASVSGIYATVDLMFGNGDGTFALPTSMTLANSYVGNALTTADFNRDGNADIAVSGRLGTIVLLLGDGKGSFTERDLIVGSDFMTGVAVGDFNGDGVPDLAVGASPSSSSSPQNNAVAVLIGNGDGTFQLPTYYPVDPFPNQVAVRDLNGDGIPDIVTSNNSGTLSILLGKGDGTFRTAINYDGGEGGPIAVADFNGDGLPDLAIGTEVIFNTTAGIVASPSVTLSSTTINFGAHPINSNNSSSVTLKNTGNASLNVAGVAIMGADPNQFGQSNSCGLLAANASCTITVQFTPNAVGNLAATVSIEDNALNSPQVINLFGTGSDFGLSPNAAKLTIKAGATATLTLTVTPLSGFAQSVTFSCSGLPAATTCNFFPSSVAPSGSATSTVLSISTTAPSAAAAVPLLRNFARLGTTGLVLCFLPLVYPKPSRRGFKVLLSIFAFLCLGACGGGGSGPPSNSNSGTPTGTYTVVVSAISGSGSSQTTHNSALTLVVN